MSSVYNNYSVKQSATLISQAGFQGSQVSPKFKDTSSDDLVEIGAQIMEMFIAKGLEIVALDGYINLIDPNEDFREKEIRRFEHLIECCTSFGTNIVATETGTKGDTPWAFHPANETEEVWREFRETVMKLVSLAEKHGVIIALEGVTSNVMSTIKRAQRIVREIDSPNLRLVLDPFNYFYKEDLNSISETMKRIVNEISPWAVTAHAKDLKLDQSRVVRPGPGLGIMSDSEYQFYLELLEKEIPQVPLVIEHVTEKNVLSSKEFVEHNSRKMI